MGHLVILVGPIFAFTVISDTDPKRHTYIMKININTSILNKIIYFRPVIELVRNFSFCHNLNGLSKI